MRSHQSIWRLRHNRVGKVCYIFLYFSSLKGFCQRFFIHQQISGKIQKHYPILHLGDFLCANHIPGTVHKRHMNGNVITFSVNTANIINMVNASGKAPGSIYRNKGVIAINFHAKMYCCICHPHTNGAQSNDSQLFPADFTSGELFFLLFCFLCKILCGFLFFQPLNTTYNIPGSQKHSCKNHFLHTVCICPRCIKHHHTLFSQGVYGNVIDSRSGSCHCCGFFRQFHCMHVCASYQDSVCLVYFICIFIFSGKFL